MKVAIIGGGLVGSLWATFMGKAGYKVDVYEKRSDLRKAKISAGKSINLATSYRGWKALHILGIDDEIRKIALPMYGRSLHKDDGSMVYQPYGNNDQAIYSVSRGAINASLMDIAEKHENIYFHFQHSCIDLDANEGIATFKNELTQEEKTIKADLIFACDGAFSAARYHGMQRSDRFDYSQKYIADSYKELLLPANEDGSFKLDHKSLHIWPKGRFMLIALPNFDGSFTCTLFMPKTDAHYSFDNLDSDEKVIKFFKEVFPDFYDMMPNLMESWHQHPISSLAIIRCYPWTLGNVALMGDAAHATVPFYGQGMNCGFEDCSVMFELMQKYNHDWTTIFKEYELLRKPNGDAMQDLSLQNYLVMRDKVNDEDFLLLLKVERRMNYLYPDKYFPLYSMVSFSDISYTDALSKGNEQQVKIKNLIKEKHITLNTSEEIIDNIIHQYIANSHE